MKYRAMFSGRLSGAIGISCSHVVDVEGETLKDAVLALHETHDHVHGLLMKPLARFTRKELKEPIEDSYAGLRVTLTGDHAEVELLRRAIHPGTSTWNLHERYEVE